MNIEIQGMTVVEKLKTMELLWDDLCHNMTNFTSPDWHGDILKEREDQYQQGHEKFQDWEKAKKDIWNSVS